MGTVQNLINYDAKRTPKLKALQDRGIDPFPPYRPEHRRESIGLVVGDHQNFIHFLKDGDNDFIYAIAGRIVSRRKQGGVIFLDVMDQTGKIQVMIKRDISPEAFDEAMLYDLGDIIFVHGNIYLPPRKELTIHAREVTLLTKALQPYPDKRGGVVDPEVRYRSRGFDLLGNEWVRDIFDKRAKIVAALREKLNSDGYTEIETPILQPLAGGSESRPFETYYFTLVRKMSLSVSPELYINRAIIGGFEKVYALTKSFRNEGISRKHSPEFTELEFMHAYIDCDELATETEQLIRHVAQKALGTTTITVNGETVDLARKWKRISLNELICEHTGVDFTVGRVDDTLGEFIDVVPQFCNSEWLPDVVMEIYTKMVEPTLTQPTFVFGFPVDPFPITKKNPENPFLAEHFDGVIGGIEIVSADQELNDPVDQERRFTDQAKRNQTGDEPAPHDKDYIKSLEHGYPPTAGTAIGIDRLVMILTEQDSVREVIPFPMLKEI